VEDSSKSCNKPLGSIRCWEFVWPTTGGLSSSAQLHRVSQLLHLHVIITRIIAHAEKRYEVPVACSDELEFEWKA
jgi:hypothetical protein